MGVRAVFTIMEIVHMICGFLEDDKMALLSFACCNQVISETALDVLWAKMDSIMPIVPFVPEMIRDACSTYTRTSVSIQRHSFKYHVQLQKNGEYLISMPVGSGNYMQPIPHDHGFLMRSLFMSDWPLSVPRME